MWVRFKENVGCEREEKRGEYKVGELANLPCLAAEQFIVKNLAKKVNDTEVRAIESDLKRMGKILQEQPDKADRTARMLSGNLPAVADPEGKGETPITSIRLPKVLIDRLDRLTPLLSDHPVILAAGRGTRSAIIRVAIAAGLDALEAEYQTLHRKGKGKKT